MGRAVFFSLPIITVPLLPVFTLEAQEGRLVAPLAWAKTFAKAVAAPLSVTLVPLLTLAFIRGRSLPEARIPGEPGFDRAVSAGHRGGTAPKGRHPLRGDSRPWRFGLACHAPRHGVHARAQWRHALLHAHFATRHVGDQSRRIAASKDRAIKSFPEWKACSARSAARKPPPIRRRSKYWRPWFA